jgi:hypothetical protein
MANKEQRYTVPLATIGLLIGFVLDIIIGFNYNSGCQTTALQRFLGITPICIKLYFLGIWFAIIGGIIGHFIKTKGGSFFSSQP